MRKLLTLCAIATLGLLLVTSLTGIRNGYDLFMSATPLHDGARVVLIGVLLFSLAIGDAPHRVIRGVFVYFSAAVTVFALACASSGNLQIFDTLSYIMAAVILMAEAIRVDERIDEMEVADAKTREESLYALVTGKSR